MSRVFVYSLVVMFLVACKNDSQKKTKSDTIKADTVTTTISKSSRDHFYYEEIATDTEDIGECGLSDGTYSASVYYTNPETDYSATYTLDVEVEDCMLTVIYFNNGGHLDDDHISSADIDSDGYAFVYGEEGKTYEVQIDY